MEIQLVWLLGPIFSFFLLIALLVLEISFATHKNIHSIAIQKLLLFVSTILTFSFLGYGLEFGTDIGGFVGQLGTTSIESSNFNSNQQIFFQIILASIAVSIACSGIAERAKLFVYFLYSFFVGGLLYPLITHWVQTDGWLGKMGYKEGGAASAVFLAAGVASLIGSWVIGPRLGKYENAKVRAIPSNSMYFGILGVFLSWIGWLVINVLMLDTSGMPNSISLFFMNLFVAPAITTLVVLFITKQLYRKPDISMTINGTLAGIVTTSVVAPYVTLFGAVFCGVFTSLCLVGSIRMMDWQLKIDDPSGAFSVYGVSSAVGILFVGLFSKEEGLFYGGGIDLLVAQLAGIVVIVIVTGAVSLFFLKIAETIWGLRISSESEFIGKDSSEYNIALNYDGIPSVNYGKVPVKEQIEATATRVVDLAKEPDPEPAQAASEAFEQAPDSIRRFEIITNPNKLERLTQELNAIGVTGMNVTSVTGFGVQKGHTAYYRGVEVETNFLPKIKLETIVSTISTDQMLKAIRNALYTGHIGDGKIFISEIKGVVRVSTGAVNQSALVYSDD